MLKLTGKLKAALYNSQGALLRSEDFVSGSNTVTLKTYDLNPGFYTGTLTSELNTRAYFRFVVQAR
jgi:hypothetical protein